MVLLLYFSVLFAACRKRFQCVSLYILSIIYIYIICFPKDKYCWLLQRWTLPGRIFCPLFGRDKILHTREKFWHIFLFLDMYKFKTMNFYLFLLDEAKFYLDEHIFTYFFLLLLNDECVIEDEFMSKNDDSFSLFYFFEFFRVYPSASLQMYS